MTAPRIENAPGLVWKPRKHGYEARWQARTDRVQKGFSPKSARLWCGLEPSDDERARIAEACRRLQSEMLNWLPGRRRQPSKVQRERGRVYFVEDSKSIKIGFSTDHGTRLRTLQTSHPQELSLLATIPGTAFEEQVIHKRFRHLRVRGEWFQKTDELLAVIADLEATKTGRELREKFRRLRREQTKSRNY